MKLNLKKTWELVRNFFIFFWQKIIMFLLIAFFFVGICFNLWKVQGLPLWAAILISVSGFILFSFGFGKLTKVF